MSKDQTVRNVMQEFANRLDSCLDVPGGEILERIALMLARDSLRRYGGLWDVPRCRKVIEGLPGELEAAAGPEGFPDDLMRPIRASCERVARALKNV